MTDYVVEAAAKAVELASELCKPLDDEESDMEIVRRRIQLAAHLTYMAGLLRGGCAAEEKPTTNEQMLARCPETTEGWGGRHYECLRLLGHSGLHLGEGGVQWQPIPVKDSADEMGSEAWATTRGIIANEHNARLQADRLRREALDLIGEEQRKRREVAEHRDRYLRERNELLEAAKAVLRELDSVTNASARLSALVAHIERQD